MILCVGVFLELWRMNECKTMLTSDTSNNKTTTNCGLLLEAIGGESSMEDIYFGQFKKLYAKNGAVYIRIFLGGYSIDFPVANNDNKYNLYVFEKSKDVYENPKGLVRAIVYQTDKDNLKKLNKKYNNKFLDFGMVSPNYITDFSKMINKIYEEENVEEFRKKIILEGLTYFADCNSEIQRLSNFMKETDRLKIIMNGLIIKFDKNINKCLPSISSVKVYL